LRASCKRYHRPFGNAEHFRDLPVPQSVHREEREHCLVPSASAPSFGATAGSSAPVKGATYRMIGRVLGISTNTVQTHIRSMYRKLEVCTKAEATAEAFRRHLL
jgi:hypothetical protein